MRRFTGTTLVLASHNKGKLVEIDALLRPLGIETRPAGDYGLVEPEETGVTFIENAILKARVAAGATGEVAIADDSGLAVDALDGAPGIHTADWAGVPRDFGRAMQRVEDAMPPGAARTARFICALAMVWPDGHAEAVEGRVEGSLVWPPRGTLGFGYDPMFVRAGETRTYGEMPPEEKHAESHRADAFRQLLDGPFRRD